MICFSLNSNHINNEKKAKYRIIRKQYGSLFLIITILLLTVYHSYNKKNVSNLLYLEKNKTLKCPISPKIDIKEHEQIQYILNDELFRNKSVNVFSRGIQINTVVYDVMLDYSKFQKFHDYLENYFPLIYKTAKVHKINTYGLVFEFKGSNPNLKPIMLNAHQDTVPIGDPNDWKEDPFGGRYDGNKIWGRGSSDCKNLLIGLMESMEKLIEDGKANFERSVLFAFGFDEEKSGFDGAKHIGNFLENYLGKDSIFLLIDEGAPMFLEYWDDYYGMVMTGEKGYTDLTINIVAPGGHSSNPKDHTSIGMMSYFLKSYEDDMYKPIIHEKNPLLKTFECAAEQGHLPDSIKQDILNARNDDLSKEKLIEFIDNNTDFKYCIQTSQAIDIINGGDKANSLPRNVNVTINHRIIYGNTPETLFEKATKYGRLTAEKYNIGLKVRNKIIYAETENGLMNIDFFGTLLYPAKVTPDSGLAWETVTGHMRAFYEDEIYPGKFNENSTKKYIIAPSIMTPNTDTRHYWNLTDNIFKVTPGNTNSLAQGVHGPDEYTPMDSHLQVVAFFYNFISSVCAK